ncbi:VOC family protein [Tenggerimyces flavus]|uniref:VOC family protein n=1 Tax=Tenggerimyces flavus TaxID=1708749 RepID=A0ABV7YN65_9ACTN|nr:VOC family protein [Tenggerimyces flavus]MBM7789457.1 PhnB protein [Tenggerimyces flavus]
MASRLNPYLNFDGNAKQAMEFYKDVFSGTLTLNTYGEIGGIEGDGAEKIMHSQLETDLDFALTGADLPPGMEFQAGNNSSVSLSGDDSDALHGYWDKLSGSGQVVVPMEKQMWGDEFGQCVDQHGVSWLVNISPPQA